MRFPRLLVSFVVVAVAAVTAACGPQDDGADLSRFAAVSPAAPQAAGR